MDYLKSAKNALNMYREPNPDDKWDYVEQYAKLSVLISIAESLKILADKKSIVDGDRKNE